MSDNDWYKNAWEATWQNATDAEASAIRDAAVRAGVLWTCPGCREDYPSYVKRCDDSHCTRSKRYRTRHDIGYTLPFGQGICIIPAHTEAFPATHFQGEDRFWAGLWDEMHTREFSHHRHSGFDVSLDDVEEIPE